MVADVGPRDTGFTEWDPEKSVENAFANYYIDNDIDLMKNTKEDGKLTQPKPFAVYVLNCCEYFDGHDGAERHFKEKWEDVVYYYHAQPHIDKEYPVDPPDWAWAAFYSDDLYYIGQTNDLRERLLQHTWEMHRSSIFVSVFNPKILVEVEFADSREDVLILEEKLAEKYQNKDGAFAYYA